MDNHWVGHPEIKPVDSGPFQKIKDIQEGGDKKNDGFGMDIL